MIDENQVPQWILRGFFPRFMLIFTRVFLVIYVLLATTMLALVIRGLFFCSTEVIEGLDPNAPFLDKLLFFPVGFLLVCITLGIFGIRNSFKKQKNNGDSQPKIGQVSPESELSDERLT